MQQVYQRLDATVVREVASTVSRFGVPTSIGSAYEIADTLYPVVLDRRREMWSREATLLRQEFRHIEIPDVEVYPRLALRKLVTNSAGLSPQPRLMRVEAYDPATRAMQSKSVAPYLMPDDKDVEEELARRLSAGTSRHIKQASRSAVQRTADRNSMRWARQLTGQENCPFCAMLASRGAVYTRETVLKSGDGRSYHDHCDCTAVLVDSNQRDWDGKEEADELYSLWIQSGDLSTFGQLVKEMGELSGIST